MGAVNTITTYDRLARWPVTQQVVGTLEFVGYSLLTIRSVAFGALALLQLAYSSARGNFDKWVDAKFNLAVIRTELNDRVYRLALAILTFIPLVGYLRYSIASRQQEINEHLAAGRSLDTAYKLSLEHFNKASKLGSAEADYELYVYSNMSNQESDKKESLTHLERAFKRGNLVAKAVKADIFYDAGKYSEAFKLYHELTYTYREPFIWTNLALCYMQGHGVKRSPETAVNWYKLAMNKDPVAKMSYARCLLSGVGVKQDIKEGLAIYEKLVEEDYPEVVDHLIQLSNIYLSGGIKTVDKQIDLNSYDPQKAYKYAVEAYNRTKEDGKYPNDPLNSVASDLITAASAGIKKIGGNLPKAASNTMPEPIKL